MVIQAARPGEPHFIIRQVDHGQLAGQLARAFGNARFSPLAPADLMVYATTHHDDGWETFDLTPEQDPATNLPYQVFVTPWPTLVVVHALSATLNERHHPFCGLLVSMHSYGLYNGRYGLLEPPPAGAIPPEHRPAVQAMLQGEEARQARLRGTLAEDPATAAWASEAHLRRCYRQLQFFDFLALYLNTTNPSRRHPTEFHAVPGSRDKEVTIGLQPQRPGFYSLSPFPFAGDYLEVRFPGRYLLPPPPEADLAGVLNALPADEQAVTLVAGD